MTRAMFTMAISLLSTVAAADQPPVTIVQVANVETIMAKVDGLRMTIQRR